MKPLSSRFYSFLPRWAERHVLRKIVCDCPDDLVFQSPFLKTTWFDRCGGYLYSKFQHLMSDYPELCQQTRAAYFKTSAQNLRLLGHVKKIDSILMSHNVPAVVIKGMAVALHNYGDLGVRPMGDADIYIPEEYLREVLDLLKNHGYSANFPHADIGMLAEARHSGSVTHTKSGVSIDLHWRLICDAKKVEQTLLLDHTLRTNDPDGFQLRVFTSELQLLITCGHGIRHKNEYDFRWVLDAKVILETAPDFCWDKFIYWVSVFNQEAAAWHALKILSPILNRTIPSSTICELGKRRHLQSHLSVYLRPPSFYASLLKHKTHFKKSKFAKNLGNLPEFMLYSTQSHSYRGLMKTVVKK